MMVGWVFLILFLLAYFIFAGAIIYHLNVYSFSRSAKWIIRLFLAAAGILSILSLLSFAAVPWEDIFSSFR